MLRELVENLGEFREPLVIVGVALLVLLSLKPILKGRHFSEKLRQVLTAAIVIACCLVIVTGSMSFFRGSGEKIPPKPVLHPKPLPVVVAGLPPDQTTVQTNSNLSTGNTTVTVNVNQPPVEKNPVTMNKDGLTPASGSIDGDHSRSLPPTKIAKSPINEEETSSSEEAESPSPRASRPRQDARPRVAVLDCESAARGTADLLDYCTSALTTHLARTRKLLLVEREKVKAIFEEQAFSQIGDPATMIQVKRLLGAQYLATATIENVRKGDVCTKSNAYGVAIENCTYSVSLGLSVKDTTTGAVVFSDSNSASRTTQKTPYLTQAEVPLHDLLDDALSPLANAAVQRLRHAPK